MNDSRLDIGKGLVTTKGPGIGVPLTTVKTIRNVFGVERVHLDGTVIVVRGLYD